MSLCVCHCRDSTTTEEIIRNHRATVLPTDKLDAHRITVRRGSIFDDTVFALRAGFNEKQHIRVCFLGELPLS